MCRTAADASLLMSVIGVPDPRDHTALPAARIDWPDSPGDVRGLRIGLLPSVGTGLDTDPEIRAAVEAAARAFEAAGAVVTPAEPFTTREMLDGIDRFWRARAFADLAKLPEERRRAVLPAITDWAASGETMTGSEVFHGFSQIDAMAVAANRALADLDHLLLPTAPIPPFAVEYASVFDDPQRPFEHIATSLPFNMSGQPAVSVNCGYTAAGLPIGLQIVGRRFDDAGVLAAALAYEQLRPAQRPWPSV
jgi:aspartyl-tRNA(Asn)/glutamyl-tRNA(Gln) amidotransferase subunit A